MREDVTIDRQLVHCPNASTLGYGKYRAQVGDWITYREMYTDGSFNERVGRMIGRIAYAPPCGETPAIKGFILAAVLTCEMTSVAERWINPADVMRVHANAPDIVNFLQWFAGPELTRNVDWTRRAMEYGCLKPNQNAEWPEWNMTESIKRFQEYYDRRQLARTEAK